MSDNMIQGIAIASLLLGLLLGYFTGASIEEIKCERSTHEAAQ